MQPSPPPGVLEWPASWTDPALLRVVEPSPFGVLVFSQPPPEAVAEAARSRFRVFERPAWRKHAEIDWLRAGNHVFIGDGVWPALGESGGSGAAEAGPTGLPWLEANGWIIRMARDLAPGAEVWIRSAPPEDAEGADASLFVFAHGEARAHGAMRPLELPPRIAAGLAAGNAHADSWWRALCSAETWWQERRESCSWHTASRLWVVSDMAGPNQYPAAEFLNLAARRNLAWRVSLPRQFDAARLHGAAAAIYVDEAPLQGPLLDLLVTFVRQGGLLVCLEAACQAWRGLESGAGDHPRFRIMRCGKGHVALSRAGWDDPYLMAQDVHLLMSRRQDVVRLFNPGSILCWPVLSPDRRRLLVHLLNYSRRGAAHDVVVQTWKPVQSAFAARPGAPPRTAGVRREQGGWEIDVEPFDSYCALELEGNRDASR